MEGRKGGRKQSLCKYRHKATAFPVTRKKKLFSMRESRDKCIVCKKDR